MDTSIFTPTIDIDAIATDVINNSKIDEKQINDAMNQQIENLENAKRENKNIPKHEFNAFMQWKTMLLFLIYISTHDISEQKGDVIRVVKQYVESNGTTPTDFFPYKNIVIEYQIQTIFDVIKILFFGNKTAAEFIDKINVMIEANKTLNARENGVIPKIKGNLKPCTIH